MKTIGLVGGLTWHSTVEYYRIINELVNLKLGSDHSAKLLMVSLDFAELRILRDSAKFKELSQLLIDASMKLQSAGADAILLCANTAHKSVEEIEKEIKIPIIHIGRALGAHLKQKGHKKVGFLGTQISMDGTFVTGEIEKFGIEVIKPNEEEKILVNKMIAEESPPATLSPQTVKMIQKVMSRLVDQGAEAIVLGCTELPLMIPSSYCSRPLIDSTAIHAAAAVEFMI